MIGFAVIDLLRSVRLTLLGSSGPNTDAGKDDHPDNDENNCYGQRCDIAPFHRTTPDWKRI